MNDRQIDCFLEVARQLNFTRAAETLRLPQPAVSCVLTRNGTMVQRDGEKLLESY